MYCYPAIGQLVEYTRALSQEVRLLKESTQINGQYQQEQFMLLSRQVQSALKSNVEVEELPESPPLQTWNLTDWSMQVKCRVLSMLLEKEVESNSTALREAVRDATTVTHSSGNSKLSAACELLMLYLNNLLKNPNMSRYRRISTSNSSYRESLDGVFGHVELLAAVGFIQKPENTCFEYKWHNLPSNLIESSKTRDDGDGAGETGISRPKSLVEAMVLLEEAVSLLSALQISKETLLETISKSMAKDNVEQQEEVKSCESQSVAFVPSDTASNTPLSSNSVPTPSAAVTESSHIQPHDELISVTVLSTTESSGNLGDDSIIGENAESFDGSLDFMKVGTVTIHKYTI